MSGNFLEFMESYMVLSMPLPSVLLRVLTGMVRSIPEAMMAVRIGAVPAGDWPLASRVPLMVFPLTVQSCIEEVPVMTIWPESALLVNGMTEGWVEAPGSAATTATPRAAPKARTRIVQRFFRQTEGGVFCAEDVGEIL